MYGSQFLSHKKNNALVNHKYDIKKSNYKIEKLKIMR